MSKFDDGLAVRKAVLGAEFVDKAIASQMSSTARCKSWSLSTAGARSGPVKDCRAACAVCLTSPC